MPLIAHLGTCIIGISSKLDKDTSTRYSWISFTVTTLVGVIFEIIRVNFFTTYEASLYFKIIALLVTSALIFISIIILPLDLIPPPDEDYVPPWLKFERDRETLRSELFKEIRRRSKNRGQGLYLYDWLKKMKENYSSGDDLKKLLSDLENEGLIDLTWDKKHPKVILSDRGWILTEKELNPNTSNYTQHISNVGGNVNAPMTVGNNNKVSAHQITTSDHSAYTSIVEALREDAKNAPPKEGKLARRYADELESIDNPQGEKGRDTLSRLQGFLDIANSAFSLTRDALQSFPYI